MKWMLCFLCIVSIVSIAETAVPEKMQARMLSESNLFDASSAQGGILFSSNNQKSYEYDIDPIITFTKINAPFKVYSLPLQGNGSSGVHFRVLPVGIYQLDGIMFANEGLSFRSQNLMNLFFVVNPGKINYLGRLNISLKPGTEFRVVVSDNYNADINKFFSKRGVQYPVTKCLLVSRNTPSCVQKDSS